MNRSGICFFLWFSFSPIALAQSLPEGLTQLVRQFGADSYLSTYRSDELSYARTEAHIDEWQQKLEQLDYEALDVSARIDWHLIRTRLAITKNREQKKRARNNAISEYLPFEAVVEHLLKSRDEQKAVDVKSSAEQLASVKKGVSKLIDQFKESKKEGNDQKERLLTQIQALRVVNRATGLQEKLRKWYKSYQSFHPEFDWWVEKPYKSANSAIDEYTAYLNKEFVKKKKGEEDAPLIGEPIGKEQLTKEVEYAFIPYTIEELLEIAQEEFDWCELEMKKQSADLGFGDDWIKALESVRQNAVAPGEQEAAIIRMATKATEFIKQRDLITIPEKCEQHWGTSMLSHERQKTIPYAAYSGNRILVAYPTEDMSHEDKMMSMRGNSLAFIHITTPHELIPGHHLQKYYQQRYRPYRGQFWTPFYVEGWALYWELRLWDLAYGTNPEERMGMLFWRMHRCARILLTLKFHTNQTKPDEMVDFLVKRVGHEPFPAKSEVRRYISDNYSPLYQAAYMLGGKQLYQLRIEMVENGQMSEKEFNDAVLKCGPIPIELVRAELMKTPLPKEFTTKWKF